MIARRGMPRAAPAPGDCLLGDLAAEVLGIDPADALRLHDNAELLTVAVLKVAQLLQQQSERSEAKQAPDSVNERFLDAVALHWGAAPFLAAELREWSVELPLHSRECVRAAGTALCGGAYTAQRLGRALGRLALVGSVGGRVLLRVGERDHSALWVVHATDDGDYGCSSPESPSPI